MTIAVDIRKVENRKMMMEFIKLPWKLGIYDNDPAWVPPVIRDQKKFFDPEHGYFFEVGEAEFFIAYRNGAPVGRITAHVNRLYEEKYDKHTGFFGFYESINDIEVAKALFNTAEATLKRKGKTVMQGPQSFSVYDSVGFEVHGMEITPVVGIFHFAPFYKDLAEACGFRKTIDWGCYLVTKENFMKYEPYLKTVRENYQSRQDVEYKLFNKKDKTEIKRRIQDIKLIFNTSWEGNWGHLPLTDRQLEYFVHELLPVIVPEFAIFAEKEGKTVGCILSVPDVNPALQALNGKLYPWRLVKALRTVKKAKTIRTMIMGVLPEFRGQKIDDVFYLRTIEDGIRLGFEQSDCSLIVETNVKMIGALKPLNAVNYKTYRIYDRDIK